MIEIVPKDSRYVPLTQQKWCCVPTCFQMIMLRKGISLIPAEELGHYMGLTVPQEALKYFYNGRSGNKPISGWGTQLSKPEHGSNSVFEKLKISLKVKEKLIDKFGSNDDLLDYLLNCEKNDVDVLLCFDWPSLFDKNENDSWGHVCVFDRVVGNRKSVRIVDPSQNSAKWIIVGIDELYSSMMLHGPQKSGGCWEVLSR